MLNEPHENTSENEDLSMCSECSWYLDFNQIFLVYITLGYFWFSLGKSIGRSCERRRRNNRNGDLVCQAVDTPLVRAENVDPEN